MEVQSHTPASTQPGPDWSQVEYDVNCPLCDYNLRGLVEPRCPECGFRFVWSEVLDPVRRKHPYLFEHHPRTWFRSFWKTLWAGWRPRRFWTTHALVHSFYYRMEGVLTPNGTAIRGQTPAMVVYSMAARTVVISAFCWSRLRMVPSTRGLG